MVMAGSVIRKTGNNVSEERCKFKGQKKYITQLLSTYWILNKGIWTLALGKCFVKLDLTYSAMHYATTNRREEKKAISLEVKKRANIKEIKIYRIWSIFCIKNIHPILTTMEKSE